MGTNNGAAMVASMLHRAGIEHVFTLSGNQILPLYDAFIDQGISVVDTRHEAAAVHMADARAQVSGKPGVCLVTAGPGHLNAVGAAAAALQNESPVLWLSGGSDLESRGLGGFQEIDQVGVARPVCKGAWQPTSIAELPEVFALAWRTMLEGRPGPVHITLPSDLLEAEYSGPDLDLKTVSLTPNQQAADSADVEKILRLLSDSARPLVLASPSLGRGHAGQQLRAFSTRTGVPWFVIESARGLLDPALNGLGARINEADMVLLLAPADFAVNFGRPDVFSPSSRVITVTPPRSGLPGTFSPAMVVHGHAPTVIESLLDGCEDFDWEHDDWNSSLDESKSAARTMLERHRSAEDVPLHPLRVAAAIRDAIPATAILSQDGGEFSQWIRWEFGDSDHATLVNGKLGLIGSGIPYALGAAHAEPGRRVIAFLGDGTFGFHGMEFDTAVRHNIPIIAVVGNDAAWAAEKHRQLHLYGQDRLVASDLLPTRYDTLVQALGGHGELVERPDQIRPAFERALASGKPACLNVMIESVPSPAKLH